MILCNTNEMGKYNSIYHITNTFWSVLEHTQPLKKVIWVLLSVLIFSVKTDPG